ncbi:MAG: carbohydrate kinase family protein [Burkholderiales bacterium]|nr:MAG: carbohydrate kinase family protein [Burkholderiales bacterium]
MSAIICGSVAIDTILTFMGDFAEQILPDQIHKLNVSFYVPGMRKEYGGCAGNIAYALKQLGGDPLPMAAVGPDASDYLDRFQKMGIDTRLIMVDHTSYTALCTIMTDRGNNQITGFHPGAMANAHKNLIAPAEKAKGVSIGIISPDGRDAMWDHAHQFKAAGIGFIFDPGQQLPVFNGAEHRELIVMADYVTVNDYEGAMLTEKTGWSMAEVSNKVKGLVVTLADQGCEVWTKGNKVHVPGVKATEIVDPTGCGDAFRAALLFGLERGWSLERCCELGNKIGAIKIASQGGQNWTVDRASVGL